MALTPEDIVNKRFRPTKLREGYNQDDVDNFLDEIVLTLRASNTELAALQAQVTSLRRQLDAQ